MARIPLDDKEEKFLESHRLVTMAIGDVNVSMQHDPLLDDHRSISPLTMVSDRMYFNESLMDLFVMEHIDKKEFIRLRSLFKNNPDDENRKLAVTMVEELHKKYF